MNKKKGKTAFAGKSLVKDRFGGRGAKKGVDSFLHTSDLNDGYDWNRLNLQSVTEQNTLEEFLTTAQLAGTEFAAEKLNITFIDPNKDAGLPSHDELEEVKQVQCKHKELLRIPRRPLWDATTTAEELDQKERESFLQWRRELAELQEIKHLILTPFERNLEFWRQLWRVIERSDVVVQIVDARNPLLFRCQDLEKYVNEVGNEKANMILINKADHLTQQQRQYWSDYFDKEGIHVAFWSAIEETERNKQNAAVSDDSDDEYTDEEYTSEEDSPKDTAESSKEDNQLLDRKPDTGRDSDRLAEHESLAASTSGGSDHTLDNNVVNNLNTGVSNIDLRNSTVCDTGDLSSSIENVETSNHGNVISSNPINGKNTDIRNSADLQDGTELVEEIRKVFKGKRIQENHLTVGMVGYPNVGKSSTINALLQTKKVPVSATPGRTKHFQTLFLENDLLLCDCPGLVMPTFVSTKAEMVISGILPIDQMRDYVPPVALVCRLIPRTLLERIYGIVLPQPAEGEEPDRPPTAHELLSAYGYMRGYMTHKGIPDFQRSARCILKDFMNGKLLYCHPPPDISADKYKPTSDLSTLTGVKQNIKAINSSRVNNKSKNDVDTSFFTKSTVGFGSKGNHSMSGLTRKSNHGVQYHSSDGSSISDKPWKKHNNRKKKEKLRRLYRDLDA